MNCVTYQPCVQNYTLLLVISKIILASVLGFRVLFWPWPSLIFMFQDLFFTFLFFSFVLPVLGLDLKARLSWLGPCRHSGISLATGTSSEGSRSEEHSAAAQGGRGIPSLLAKMEQDKRLVYSLRPGSQQLYLTSFWLLLAGELEAGVRIHPASVH